MLKKDGFSVPAVGDIGRTVVGRLIPAVDRVRDIATKLGVRAYTVSLVRTRWSGGARGEGQEIVENVLAILPTPRVTDVGSIAEQIEATGRTERGIVKVDQISGRFTEDELLGNDVEGRAPDADQQFWWEIQYLPVSIGSTAEIRRFEIARAPEYLAGKVYWKVYLRRAYDNRSRFTGETR